MSEEERYWKGEEKALTAIYVRRGYKKAVAEAMAQQETEKRKIEGGYRGVILGRADGEVREKVKSKTVKSQKKGAKK